MEVSPSLLARLFMAVKTSSHTLGTIPRPSADTLTWSCSSPNMLDDHIH